MGCVSSKTDINDRHPNIFQVTNVNDQGRPISPGKLQVTETELVLYQRGKEPTKWPLRSLRKYGFDTEVFSFECGRRCPTGHGIYAFRCRKAEQLFNIVQQHITGNVNDENNPISNNLNTNIEFPIPVVSTGPPVQRRIGVGFQPEGYLNPVAAPSTTRSQNMLSRPGSVSSNGPLSPTTMGSLVTEPSYTNTNVILENGSVLPNYANLGVTTAEATAESFCHVYMNVDTKICTKDVNVAKEMTDIPEKIIETEEKHCYANIDAKDIENLRPMSDTHFSSVPATPTIPYSDMEYVPEYITVREVNYAELDLDQTSKNVSSGSQVVPESPKVEKKSYATIDFQKTTALSQSINPRMTVEEGSRKTRHNSTINYNNSLSD
ncbi:hypothetical protein NQ314_014468 [Rhamnusium bicolor]|uniref:IRS-type PTB domain-containing protein n=1 Tax=Rhamnusium bicolor TaxID=1586634 RepID=A0AAV8X2P7_9CUCU|nr:hypothetical protein NQ314_014468 [Rhamnusium bicolor]